MPEFGPELLFRNPPDKSAGSGQRKQGCVMKKLPVYEARQKCRILEMDLED